MANQTDITSRPITLAAVGSWPETRHQFEEKGLWAVRAATAARRPLLVRGEPGTGKSQLARAAAHIMRRAFVSQVVHARSECHDLQYYFDAVARLGEAQTLGCMVNNTGVDVKARLDPIRFISPGVLWWTFDWIGAQTQYEKSNQAAAKPPKPSKWEPRNGTVLLIDEIDKADADLPNGLLETLGNGAFTVPYLDDPVCVDQNLKPPLVVITTNEERELPAAFIRRCMVLNLKLPEEDQELVDWLCQRGWVHFEKRCSETVRKKAALQLVKDRSNAKKMGIPTPGQAEYLDMLRAVIGIAPGDEKGQLAALAAVSEFALMKHS